MKRQPKMEAVAVTGFLALCLLVSSADRPLAEGAGPVKETTGLAIAPAGGAAPAGWLAQVEHDLAEREYEVSWQESTGAAGVAAAWHAPNREQGFRTYFTPDGIRVVPRKEGDASWRWGLSLVGYGRGGKAWAVPSASLTPTKNRIEYRRGNLQELYENRPDGLEQSFILASPPGAEGSDGEPEPRGWTTGLRRPAPAEHAGRHAPMDPSGGTSDSRHLIHVDLVLWGDLSPRISEDGQAIQFVTASGAPALHYAQLKTTDARGEVLPSWMEGFSGPDERGIRIVVDAKNAVYPIGIDPLATSPVWTAESDQGSSYFGLAAATAGDVNGDGYSDVIVGAYYYDNGESDEGRAFLYLGSASGLSPSASWTAEGNQVGAIYGYTVAAAGDVNGDGYSDVIVGAPGIDNGEIDEGGAFVYHGSASGLGASPAWAAEDNQANALFGTSVCTAGDVNGDGYSDVIVGAYRWESEPAHLDEGRAYVYLGSASGLSTTPSWTAERNQAQGWFGTSVSTAGDVNGDGFSDVIIGAYLYNAGSVDEGAAFVYLRSSSRLAATAAWQEESNQADAQYGASVSGAGDVNGDGYADVIVGAYLYDNGQTDEGAAFLYLGSASGLATSPAWTGEGGQGGASFGISVSTAGDINGDGYADALVGAYLHDNGETDEGRAYVYLGSVTGLASAPVWTGEGGQAGASYGASAKTAGDVNGDGFSDVIIGAYTFDNGQTDEGRAFVYLGSASGPTTSAAWAVSGDQPEGHIAQSVASAGDVNGDGYSDVIIGTFNYDNGQTDEGRVFLYLGSASGPAATPAWSVEPDQALSYFGMTIASAGDVNADGYADVLVGAPHISNGEFQEGRAYLYLGSPSGLGATPAWTAESNQESAELGWGVGTAGDANGDGYSDVLIGTPRYENASLEAGRLELYLGSSSGLSATASWSVEGDSPNHQVGWPVASAGDVNGDGYSDFLTSARWYPSSFSPVGRTYLYLGSSSGPAAVPAWVVTGTQTNGSFGASLASAGDINGDGYSDVLIGAYGFDNGQANEGRAHLYLGSASGLALTPAWTTESDVAGAQYGLSLAGAGDVNGDGYSDVIVGAPGYANGQTNEGRAYLYMGSPAGLGSSGWSVESDQAGASFGWAVAGETDVNGDGFSDVIIGMPGYDDGSLSNVGRAAIYFGGGGDGLDRVHRQSLLAGANLSLLGKSDSETDIRLRERGFSPGGRGKVQLQWELKPIGSPFTGSGLGTSTILDTGSPSGSGSAAQFSEVAAGLSEKTFYHWRTRIVGSDPFFPRSPWLSLAGNNITETKFRTAGCIDQDGDGYGAHGDPSCLSLTPDCSDSTAAIWGVPGEVLNLTLSSTALAWDPPAAPGAPVSDLVYDTLRSTVRNDFVTAAVCLESDDGPGTTATDGAVPSLGQVYYYLIRAQNACPNGEGPLGFDSQGNPRQGRACP